MRQIFTLTIIIFIFAEFLIFGENINIREKEPKQGNGIKHEKNENRKNNREPLREKREGRTTTDGGIAVAKGDFFGEELLGIPTENSIGIKLITAAEAVGYVEYGTEKGNYTSRTSEMSSDEDGVLEFNIDKLTEDTEYFYRVVYKTKKESIYVKRGEHSFHTKRKSGTSFIFTVQADSHRDENTDEELYRVTLKNILHESPDFHIDLGDTFMTEKFAKTEKEVSERYIRERAFFDIIGGDIPLFLVNGNHEGENGWRTNGKDENIAIWAAKARKKYYLNPTANSFYSGKIESDKTADTRGGYYSWEWGNSLFIVIDPFWYTTKKSLSFDENWNYTLGRQQYEWFKKTLENSRAKYKFVFAHNIVGGADKDCRGGVEPAKYFEWGGNDSDGSYGFDKYRAGWGKPIHRLMAENKVTIFFHGHDHFFAKQDLDGIVYQLVPQPGHTGYDRAPQAEEYGYIEGTILPPSGHIKVTVGNSKCIVEYIRSYLPKDEKNERINGKSGFSYEVKSSDD